MLTRIKYALDKCVESYEGTQWDQLGRDLKYFKELVNARHQFSLLCDIVSDLYSFRPNNEVWSLGTFDMKVENGCIVLEPIIEMLSEKRKVALIRRRKKVEQAVVEGEIE